ncbi:DUF3099 domain-containing protein [Agrococcus sp. 1P02AA]|uniref:DUF3099 domain-containing protein n=1 Tax=Agrococcus sp. 1P02AA TaxID=3132259 RepID=UPI0039A61123
MAWAPGRRIVRAMREHRTRNDRARKRGSRESAGSLTDLPESPDEERQRRFRLYFVLMLVRIACLGIFFIVPDWWKLIPAFFAVFIPYFAVVIGSVPGQQRPEGIEAPNALPPGSARSPEAPGASAPGTAAPGPSAPTQPGTWP